MSVLAEFSIFPLGKDTSLSPYVARVLEIIQQSGLAYVFGPMATCVEGEWDEVMALVSRCHEALRRDCDRVHLALRIDSRSGPAGRITGKIRSVEEKLDRPA